MRLQKRHRGPNFTCKEEGGRERGRERDCSVSGFKVTMKLKMKLRTTNYELRTTTTPKTPELLSKKNNMVTKQNKIKQKAKANQTKLTHFFVRVSYDTVYVVSVLNPKAVLFLHLV